MPGSMYGSNDMAAVDAMEKAQLDKLVFMPCATPPHKANMKIPSATMRIITRDSLRAVSSMMKREATASMPDVMRC